MIAHMFSSSSAVNLEVTDSKTQNTHTNATRALGHIREGKDNHSTKNSSQVPRTKVTTMTTTSQVPYPHARLGSGVSAKLLELACAAHLHHGWPPVSQHHPVHLSNARRPKGSLIERLEHGVHRLAQRAFYQPPCRGYTRRLESRRAYDGHALLKAAVENGVVWSRFPAIRAAIHRSHSAQAIPLYPE